MTLARKDIINENEIGTYHCITRCVRRAFLCGFDKFLNKSFEHRRGWVENRIKHLSKIFFIEIGTYAVLSNHLHIVLKTRPDKEKGLSDEGILQKWNELYPSETDENGKVVPLSENKLKLILCDELRIQELRKRLTSVSWFMKSLNEYIARKANIEDKCKGRFWEGRFKCQALKGDAAVLACMAYVDLNPIRAKLTEKIEESKYTGIEKRLKAYRAELCLKDSDLVKNTLTNKQNKIIENEKKHLKDAEWLSPLNINSETFIKINLKQYIDLLEWTGKRHVDGKKGIIPKDLESVLTRFEIDKQKWLTCIKKYGTSFHRIVGKIEDITLQAQIKGKKWFWGSQRLKILLSS